MSSNQAPRQEHVSSHGLDDRGSYHECAINPGQYPSDETPSDQQGRDDGYSQPHNTIPQAQRRLSTTNTEDERNRPSSTDYSRNGDHGQRGAGVGFVGSSRYGKDGYNGRSSPIEGANSPGGGESSHKGTSAGVVEDYDDESMPPDEHEMRSDVQIQKLQQQIHFLKVQHDIHTKKIAELRDRLKVEAENNKKTKESANKMAYAMESKDLYIGRQDSDDAVYSRFQVLFGQIKTWSVPFAQNRPPSHLEFAPEVVREFQKVAPVVTDFPRFLQTPKNMRLFVRGHVSLTIAEMLFRTLPSGTHPGSGKEDIWMDRELAHGVSLIENRLFYADRKAISPREFHDWRALTTTLISRLDDASKNSESVTQCSNRVMGIVGNWVAPDNRKALADTLSAVLLQAVNLSQTLRCQRAYWSVRHLGDATRQRPQSGPPDDLVFFDEATMDDKHGDEDSDGEGARVQYGKVVEIFITPGLFKSGNSDGELFDIERCVERSEVKCLALSVGAGCPVLSR